jgi:hypothetical protein
VGTKPRNVTRILGAIAAVVGLAVLFVRTRPPALAVAPSTPADAVAIAAQKVCPIGGQPLETSEIPLKVSRGGRAVFLCCECCLDEVQADPDRYLTAAASPPPAVHHK